MLHNLPIGVITEQGRRNPTQRIFDILEQHAIDSPGLKGRFKLACAIVYKKTIITVGTNSYKTHPIMEEYGNNKESIFLHAEIDAFNKALKLLSKEQLAKCDLYILRVKRDKKNKWVRGLAKPCKGCMKAIAQHNIRNIFFTQDNDAKRKW
jgi:tRNA(Arg) A34 adenosine deaminase TadA|tara:strand:- start:1746 stop:2198 length:453 start_codon:yes stop_codon:yes gene_type:complete